MFKYKHGIGVDYDRQGYIYFLSRRYHQLTPPVRAVVDDMCLRCGGEYQDALREFVTTDHSATEICLNHYISQATLYRCVSRYYQQFPDL